MNDDLEALRGAWQDQTRDDRRFSTDELRAAEARMERTVRNRNLREGVAALFVIPFFTGIALLPDAPVVQRLGAALLVLGTISILVTLWRRGRTLPPPADLAADGLAWQVRELERERELLATVPRWYLGPLVPGMILFLAGPALAIGSTGDALRFAGVALFQVLVGGGVWWMNRYAARALDRELADLRRTAGS